MAYGLALACVAAGGFSAVSALGWSTVKANPSLASALPIPNGFADQRIANAVVVPKILEEGNPQLDPLPPGLAQRALQAFRREPLTTDALAILATDPARSLEQRRALMTRTQSLSRRNNLAVLWQIRDRGLSGDLDGVIQQYDLGMRRGGVIAGILNVNLVRLLANPSAVPFVDKMLRRNPPWAERFWLMVPNDRSALKNAAQLRLGLVGQRLSQAVYSDAPLLSALVDTGLYAEAAELHAALATPIASRGELVRNASFDGSNPYPPFDWQLVRSGNYAAEIDSNRGVLNLQAQNADSPVFARQLLTVRPGTYELGMQRVPGDDRAVLPVRLRLGCALPGTGIPQREFDFSKTDRYRIGSTSACTLYWLDIVAAEPANSNFDAFAISSISLRRVD